MAKVPGSIGLNGLSRRVSQLDSDERKDLCFAICRFSLRCFGLVPRATSLHAQSLFSNFNSFWCKFDSFFDLMMYLTVQPTLDHFFFSLLRPVTLVALFERFGKRYAIFGR